MTKNLILDNLWRSSLIDDMIWNITNGHHLKDDLKTELFIILCEMPDSKIINAYKGKWLNYLCVNIITKQWKSKTSPFYKKYKKDWNLEGNFDIADELDEFPYDLLEEVMKIIEQLPFVEKELFMMRYKIGKYDRWLGELRDTNCKKSISSFKKVELKLAINTITISHSTVEKYHRKVIEKIRKQLSKKNINYD